MSWLYETRWDQRPRPLSQSHRRVHQCPCPGCRFCRPCSRQVRESSYGGEGSAQIPPHTRLTYNVQRVLFNSLALSTVVFTALVPLPKLIVVVLVAVVTNMERRI